MGAADVQIGEVTKNKTHVAPILTLAPSVGKQSSQQRMMPTRLLLVSTPRGALLLLFCPVRKGNNVKSVETTNSLIDGMLQSQRSDVNELSKHTHIDNDLIIGRMFDNGNVVVGH